jgi:hypothetical protein
MIAKSAYIEATIDTVLPSGVLALKTDESPANIHATSTRSRLTPISAAFVHRHQEYRSRPRPMEARTRCGCGPHRGDAWWRPPSLNRALDSRKCRAMRERNRLYVSLLRTVCPTRAKIRATMFVPSPERCTSTSSEIVTCLRVPMLLRARIAEVRQHRLRSSRLLAPLKPITQTPRVVRTLDEPL